MFKSLVIDLTLLFLIINTISCRNSNHIDTSNIYSYEYNFESYGLKDASLFKASTVAALENVIKDRKTAIFVVSSPLCSSCRSSLQEITDICLGKDFIVYNIDTYSDIYPVFGDDSFTILLEILKKIGINNEDELVLPVILIINEGRIDGFITGDVLHSNDNSIQTNNKIREVLLKSSLY